MKRILPPEEEDRREYLVEKFIITLEKVHSKFNYKSRGLIRFKLHTKPNGTKFKIFWRAIDYLIKIRGAAGNPIDWLIEDYITCFYEMSKNIEDLPPQLNYFSPTDNVQMRFEEWIAEKERKIYPDEYWMVDEVNLSKLKEDVNKKVEEMNKMQSLKKVPEPININIIERG